MKTNISQLKARLSEYLAEVRRGCCVVVCDRHTPIAKIIPFHQDDGLQIQEPTLSCKAVSIAGVALKHPVDVVGLLRDERDQR